MFSSLPCGSAPGAEFTLPRRTPPLKPKASVTDGAYHSLPKPSRPPSGSTSPPATHNLPSDYKYAHDRLSHFRMSTDERLATKEGMVWQLYEWQQRQQFRHGSPTAPIYGGPNFTDSSSSSAFRVTVEMPRSISVPPSPCEVPPSVPPSFKPLSPHRPHTPSERRTIRPLDEVLAGNSTRSSSPGHICARLSQVGPLRRGSPLQTTNDLLVLVRKPKLLLLYCRYTLLLLYLGALCFYQFRNNKPCQILHTEPLKRFEKNQVSILS